MKFPLGDPRPQIWHRGPLISGALVRDTRAAPNAERTAAPSAAVAEKIAIEKKSLTPSSGETGGGVAPNRACRAGPPRRTIAESFVDLSRRVRTLFDFFEISICPMEKMHVPNRANSLLYTRTQRAKTLTTESRKNSSTAEQLLL